MLDRLTRSHVRRYAVVLCGTIFVVAPSAYLGNHQPVAGAIPVRPNIILIVTDDQRFDSLSGMPNLQRLLVNRGMTIRNAIVSNPICCPSRATILTGRYSHSTGVYTNEPPNGGWAAFRASEADTIATALHETGYRTGFVGKYLNGYHPDTAPLYVPPGWDRWFAYSSPMPGYYDYRVFHDRRGTVRFGSQPQDYSTDVFRRQAQAFIRRAPSDAPFFLMVAPKAPHSPFVAAPRHEGDFDRATVRLGVSVNEANVSDKPAYIRELGIRNPVMIRQRVRDQREMLLAVDDMVAALYAALVDTGRVRSTLVIYTSDNGYSNSEHRWPRKQVPYEQSIRVPFVVRYPGHVPPDSVSSALVSNVDLAPTIADFAGAELAANGLSLRALLTDNASVARNDVVLEHLMWKTTVPTYCGVRTNSFTFVRYATGEEELYDLANDRHQLENVVRSRPAKATELRNLAMSLCQPAPPGFSW